MSEGAIFKHGPGSGGRASPQTGEVWNRRATVSHFIPSSVRSSIARLAIADVGEFLLLVITSELSELPHLH
jgi:hypothetical protein